MVVLYKILISLCLDYKVVIEISLLKIDIFFVQFKKQNEWKKYTSCLTCPVKKSILVCFDLPETFFSSN